jgi:hypothetical protein
MREYNDLSGVHPEVGLSEMELGSRISSSVSVQNTEAIFGFLEQGKSAWTPAS